MVGQTVSHYKILEKVGEGGMGVVYRGQDLKLGRLVALKFLPAEFTRDAETKQRFIQEAKAASALDHPNICTVYEIGNTPDGRLFIAMAYYEGKTMQDMVALQQLPIEDIVSYAIQAADGVQAAHKKRIVHRDIKSSNIMVTADRQVKLMDFGLAKTSDMTMVTKTGLTVGTVPYMSPEQARGEKVDHRTDIWSLGIVLYEMITGRLPFQSSYNEAIIYSILNENPPPVLSLRVEVPDALQRVINKCLEKKPEDRYQRVDEIIADLRNTTEALAAPLPLSTRVFSRGWPWKVTGVLAAIVVGVLTWSLLQSPPALTPERASIAVLPFNNMSDSREDEYFSDGVTDEIIMHLSRIKVFKKVISRTSTMFYKTKEKDLAEIRKSLDVELIVEGTVRRAGTRVRINAQLVDARNGENLWVNTYDRELTDILLIQESIARDIVTALHAALSPDQENRLTQRPIESIEAYNYYLLGNYHFNRASPEAFSLAERYYRQALSVEPNAAIVHAKLAELYYQLPWFGFLSPEEGSQKAQPYLTKALELDDILAEVQTALALNKSFYQWDWKNGEKAYVRAIELNPNSSTANFWYGLFLTIMQNDLAEEHWRRLVEIDPLSVLNRGEVGWMYYMIRDYDKSIQTLDETIKLDSTWFDAYHHLGWAYVQKGMYKRAIALHEKAVAMVGGSDVTRAGLAFAYAVGGQPEKAREIAKELITKAQTQYVPPYQIAIVLTGLGENNNALAWLSRGIEEGDVWMPMLNLEPAFDPLRPDSRFNNLMRRMNLADESQTNRAIADSANGS